MVLTTAMRAFVLAADLEARGIIAGIGKLILIVIIVLVVLGALLGFRLGRRGGRR
jgi:sulfur transfer complex TusBCD TusB component (DsrH family)